MGQTEHIRRSQHGHGQREPMKQKSVKQKSMKRESIKRETMKREQKAGKSIWAAMVPGLLIAVVITAAGLLIGAWLLDRNIISDGKNQYIGIIAAVGALSLLAGGGYAAAVSQEKPVYTAMGVGGFYILLRIAAAFLIGDGWKPDMLWWGQSALQIGASFLGGMIGKIRK